MNVRYLQKKDISRLKELHKASGFEYVFPNLEEFMPIPVVVNENDEAVMAIGCLPTVEVFFIGDPNWETPGIRFEHFKFLHEFVRRQLRDAGVVQGHVFLPPILEKSLGRRLRKTFGWARSYWPCFSKRVD